MADLKYLDAAGLGTVWSKIKQNFVGDVQVNGTSIVTRTGQGDPYGIANLTIDSSVTQNSTNPVQGGAVYTELANKADSSSLTGLAPLDSPAFTGGPTAPTPTFGDDTTKIATTAFVQAAIQAAAMGIQFVIVADYEHLPATGSTNTIYLVGPNGTSPDIYEEYVWVIVSAPSTYGYEKIGTTAVDLSNYVQHSGGGTLVELTAQEIASICQ